MRTSRIVIAGGGTGGHVFPAIAIAEEIRKRKPDAEITFIGTKNKIESRIIPQRGYPFRSIWISGWSRKLRWDSLLFPLKVIVAMIQSYWLMKRIKPDVVVGTGGYVCGPVVRTAVYMGIPTVIQEQNSYPGVTTRVLAPKTDRVHITFDETRKYLKRTDNVSVSGNPTRNELDAVSREDALEKFKLDPSRPVVLVFGGSLGAATINSAVIESIPVLEKHGAQVIWLTGDAHYEVVRRKIGERNGFILAPFTDDMAYAYAAATLAICRAGATTISELTRTGVPAIIVPYPYATANHQEFNARTLAEHGAARMILNADLIRDLPGVLDDVLSNPDLLTDMRKKAKSMGKPDAGRIIADSILELAERKTQ
jgi:UDP-N-acetylglucosamine--N-acetylmuramyl-(pentapeptide) pyrophosphoryl-undecaprenol N-acetylglucosamine transferase